MCGICGCEATLNSKPDTRSEPRFNSEAPAHSPEHGPHVHHDATQHHHALHQESAHQKRRLIQVEQDLFNRNNHYASQNRELFKRIGVLAINLMSSPGSGKTTLLVETIQALKDQFHIAVIEGDQQTRNDAERIAACGINAHQINTGKGCHLDAHQIMHGLEHLPIHETELLFIENVGNLVCPAGFDLGEYGKVVVLSVAEGDDKPLKYPDMFRAASLMVINKVDLLPYVDFSVESALEFARRINPDIECITVSARTGENMVEWLNWLTTASATTKAAQTI